MRINITETHLWLMLLFAVMATVALGANMKREIDSRLSRIEDEVEIQIAERKAAEAAMVIIGRTKK
jgi:hypothetical protein